MNAEQLKQILEDHSLWLAGDDSGKRANLQNADLTGVYLTGADLTGAYLTGAYLARTNLARTNLSDADLSDAYLTGADLTGVYLTGADLRGADLSGADLTGAHLARTNLSDADLTGADLTGADMARTNLSDADLTGAYLDKENDLSLQGNNPLLMINPIGSESGTLIAYKTNKGIYLRRGCFFGTMGMFLAAVQKTHGDRHHGAVYRAACQFIEVWEEQR